MVRQNLDFRWKQQLSTSVGKRRLIVLPGVCPNCFLRCLAPKLQLVKEPSMAVEAPAWQIRIKVQLVYLLSSGNQKVIRMTGSLSPTREACPIRSNRLVSQPVKGFSTQRSSILNAMALRCFRSLKMCYMGEGGRPENHCKLLKIWAGRENLNLRPLVPNRIPDLVKSVELCCF